MGKLDFAYSMLPVMQVQVAALNREAARIRAHNEVHSAAK